MHIAPAVGNQVNHNLIGVHSINQPIGLEQYLAVLRHSQRPQFLWNRPALGVRGKGVADIEQALQ